MIILTILDNKQNILDKRKVKIIPRMNELIYLDKTGKYYSVLNVTHRYSTLRFLKFIKAEGYFITVEELLQKPK